MHRTDHYSWIAGLLLDFGVTFLVELGDVLREADEVAIADGWTTCPALPSAGGPGARSTGAHQNQLPRGLLQTGRSAALAT